MKKVITLCMMIIALGFVTVGCGGGGKPDKAPAPDATSSHEGHDHAKDAVEKDSAEAE